MLFEIILCTVAGVIIISSLFLLITQLITLWGIYSSCWDLINIYTPLLCISNCLAIYMSSMFLLMSFFELPDLFCAFYKISEIIGIILLQIYLFGLEMATLFRIYLPQMSNSWEAFKLKRISLFIGVLTTLPLFGVIFAVRGQILWSVCTGQLDSFFERRKQAQEEISWLWVARVVPYLCFMVMAISAYNRKIDSIDETVSVSLPTFNKPLGIQISFFAIGAFSRGIYIYFMPSDIDINVYKFVFWCYSFLTVFLIGPSTSVLVLLFNKGYRSKVFAVFRRNYIAPLVVE